MRQHCSHDPNDGWRTNGVSFGPHMSASQVKKSDSEIGPFAGGGEREREAWTDSGIRTRQRMDRLLPAVNIPSGAPVTEDEMDERDFRPVVVRPGTSRCQLFVLRH